METAAAIPATEDRRRTGVLLAVLVLVWACELLIIQEVSSHPDESLPLLQAVKYAARRMALNLAACSFLVCLLRRFWLHAASLVGLIFSTIIVTYADYFEHPLSWTTISLQWNEGTSIAGHAASLISWPVVAVLLAVFAVKIGLREAVERRPPLAGLRRRGVVAGVAYLVLAVGFAGFYKPITRVNVGSPEYTYGYAVAWATEFLSYDAEVVLEHAIAKAAVKSRKLTEVEAPLDFGRHIVVVQVESLDYDAIDATTAGGEDVMPFLRYLKGQSMTYMVKPFHATGSSDADFALLTASTPNGRITPFKVVGFPFGESLPWLVERFGYTAVAIHGNTGAFFQRRNAYEQMGFSKLYFDQELDDCGVNGAYDDELLRFSARLIRESSEPMFHFVITWTSHGPFNKLPSDAETIHSSPKSVDQRYVNCMRYVDRALEEYYRELPDDTTVVIYGDHHSCVQGYASGTVHKDRVPWIICRKGKNLAEQHQTARTGLATSGNLTQLDMACYLRDSLQTFATIANQERAKRNQH